MESAQSIVLVLSGIMTGIVLVGTLISGAIWAKMGKEILAIRSYVDVKSQKLTDDQEVRAKVIAQLTDQIRDVRDRMAAINATLGRAK